MIYLWYGFLALIYIGVITWMVVHNKHLRTKLVTLKKKGRLPICNEEGIALATEEREHAHGHASVW